MAARMANGAGDNVCAMFIPLLHDDSMCAQCARNILLGCLPTLQLHVPARVALLTDLALVDAMAGLMIFVPVCMRLFASRPSYVALFL